MKEFKAKLKEQPNFDIIHIESEKDYHHFEKLCGFCVKNNVHLSSRHIKDGYQEKDFDCPESDDGYCLAEKKCEHCQKVGVYKLGEVSVYPLIGDYIIVGTEFPFSKNMPYISVMSEEEFKKTYKEM